jgi:O-succinylbenzoate synthase
MTAAIKASLIRATRAAASISGRQRVNTARARAVAGKSPRSWICARATIRIAFVREPCSIRAGTLFQNQTDARLGVAESTMVAPMAAKATTHRHTLDVDVAITDSTSRYANKQICEQIKILY